MPNFKVEAMNDNGGGEGPFIFNAPDAEAACDMYRAWAWAQVKEISPLSNGPLPHVEAVAVS